MKAHPPSTTVVSSARADRFRWHDAAWMRHRAMRQSRQQPLSIYQVDVATWRHAGGRPLGYRKLATTLVPYARALGFTHLELLGVAVPSADLGNPGDFQELVDRAHRAGLGILVEWTPGRAAGDPTDPLAQIETAIARLRAYHLDGLRLTSPPASVDWLQQLSSRTQHEVPGVLLLASDSGSRAGWTQPIEAGGLGFDLLWNRGWTNDTLAYVQQESEARQLRQRRLTTSMVYAFSERFLLPLARDEVTGGKGSLWGKMPGDDRQRFANLRLLLGYTFAHPGKKLLFMGGEFGQIEEWHEQAPLDWELIERPVHAEVQAYVRDLNRLYTAEPALHELDGSPHGFEWIDFRDTAHSVLAFIRRGLDPEEFVVVVVNWSSDSYSGYRIGIPVPGVYQQLVNSDAATYGGLDRGVFRTLEASPEPAMRRPYSLALTLPPLGILVLKRVRPEAPARSRASRPFRSSSTRS